MKPLFTLLLLMTTTLSFAQEKYTTGPNSERYKGIPAGTVTQYTWESRIYKNTIRDYYVYVPAQYNGSIPAALMVFQDGHTYLKEDGDFLVPSLARACSSCQSIIVKQNQFPIRLFLHYNQWHCCISSNVVLTQNLPQQGYYGYNQLFDRLPSDSITQLAYYVVAKTAFLSHYCFSL
jgi:hypothetical protein